MKLTDKAVAIGVAVIIVLQVLILAGRGKDAKVEDKAVTTTDAQVTKKKTKTIVTKKPDGTTSTETSVTETAGTTRTVKGETHLVTASKKTSINALVGIDATRAFTPVYGVSLTREVLGPITLGAYGLTNGTIGLSLGVNF